MLAVLYLIKLLTPDKEAALNGKANA